ncbi:hypothetical protein ABEP13_04445 [Geobacillus stearothermophilus]|uniref:hypothetical protein n=1 Tax=Geobacillus TaxID=129337 RepID=UPI000EF44BB1|nr:MULTISPECIES: hypothetical protein [Geobacillus]MED4300066.1 hypothetical protein [Geobacillus stearothermophilus]NNU98352.1 hypothetical protein [Geobacillus sp. DSP4a]RLP89821.1 hypothetical protein D9546_04855 [Geobacillus stearothermophilus]
MNRFHACATCIHYRIEKRADGLYTYCRRLGYETKPNYRFNCWTPKPNVRRLMEKEAGKDEDH